MSRPLVKICGLTRVDEARLAVELGADLLGLNFYSRSPRFLKPEQAREIADSVRREVQLVGVFVNSDMSTIQTIDREVGLDLIQLHGDEEDSMIQALEGRAIRAFRLAPGGDLPDLSAYPRAWGFLFDRGGNPRYGGTGETWRYDRIAGLETSQRTLIAGGIRPENARGALVASQAGGIDVCSGVEWSPGRKDTRLMKRLFEEIRHGETPRPA